MRSRTTKKVVKYICDNCGEVKESATAIQRKRESYPVKGDPIEIDARVRVCLRCGSAIYDRFLDSINQQTAFEVYRNKHGIVSPGDIKALRARYGLAQKALAKLLGWGEITIHRYESGSLPDDSHNQVLTFIQQPANMRMLINQNIARLQARTARKLIKRISAISEMSWGVWAGSWSSEVAQTGTRVCQRLSSGQDSSFEPFVKHESSTKSVEELRDV